MKHLPHKAMARATGSDACKACADARLAPHEGRIEGSVISAAPLIPVKHTRVLGFNKEAL